MGGGIRPHYVPPLCPRQPDVSTYAADIHWLLSDIVSLWPPAAGTVTLSCGRSLPISEMRASLSVVSMYGRAPVESGPQLAWLLNRLQGLPSNANSCRHCLTGRRDQTKESRSIAYGLRTPSRQRQQHVARWGIKRLRCTLRVDLVASLAATEFADVRFCAL